MTPVLLPLAECGLRVSLVAAAALGGVLLAGRRRPAARAAIAASGLVAILLLTLLIVVPLPNWWRWELPTFQPVTERPAKGAVKRSSAEDLVAPSGHNPHASNAVPDGVRWDVFDWTADARWLIGSRPSAKEPVTTHWQTIVLVLLGGGVSCRLLCLGWSLATALRIFRHSHPIPNPELHSHLAELARRLGCSRSIALRQSTELNSAATMGWLRAVIVLPIQWREWSAAERRSVLAHEVAHILRRDFPTRCVARLTGALHFYHPLVRWLARSVVLNQELSADELATQAAGGHNAYLQALSRLALREDDRLRSVSIASLPVFSSFLIRRIEMLQAMQGIQRGPSRRWLRWTAGGLLFALALAATGVRGTAAPPDDETPTNPGNVTPASATKTGPVDAEKTFARTPVDPSAMAVVARPQQFPPQGAFVIRVAELLKRPGLARWLPELNRALHLNWKYLFESTEVPDVRMEDIEYVMSDLHVALKPAGDSHIMLVNGNQRLAFGSNLVHVRLRKRMDWQQLARWFPNATWERHAGVKFLKVPFAEELGWTPIWLLPADDQTVVIAFQEDIAHRIIEQRGTAPPAPDWLAHWQAADGGLVMILTPTSVATILFYETVMQTAEFFTNFYLTQSVSAEAGQSANIAADQKDPEPEVSHEDFGPEIQALINNMTGSAWGVDWADSSDVMDVRLHVAFPTETTAKEACDVLERLIASLRRSTLHAKTQIDPRAVQFLTSLSVTASDRLPPDAHGVTVRGTVRLTPEGMMFGNADSPFVPPDAE